MFTIETLQLATSPGLVRRAEKALQKSQLTLLGVTEGIHVFKFEEQTGQLNVLDITTSRCSCPAPGVCKHIVAAALKTLKSSTFLDFDWPNVLFRDLCEQAGKAAVRYLYKLKDKVDHNKTSIELLEQQVLLQSPLLKGYITAGDKLVGITCEPNTKQNQLICAWLYANARKQSIEWPEWLQTAADFETLKSLEKDKQWKKIISAYLIDQLKLGVDKWQYENFETLFFLIPELQSHGQKYFANQLKQMRAFLQRKMEAIGFENDRNLLRVASELFAHCHRTIEENSNTVSEELTELTCLCLGGYQWKADSGAVGLTMLFVDQTSNVFSASLSRKNSMIDFSAISAWYNLNLWEGSPMNYELSGRTCLLTNPKFIEAQRLSLSKNTGFTLADSAKFSVEGTNNWNELKNLEPYEFSILDCSCGIDLAFDDQQQKLVMTVRNHQGHRVFLELPYQEWLEPRITQLLECEKQIEAVVIQHTLYGNQHKFEPILIKENSIWHSFDFEKVSKRKQSFLRSLVQKFATSPEINRSEPSHISKIMIELETVLIDYPYYSEERLKTLSKSLLDLGLTSLAELISRDSLSACNVLKARYLLHLSYQSMSLWPIEID